MESIIGTIITGACSIVGVILASAASSSKMQKQLEISQAVMNTKIENLAAEVRVVAEMSRQVPVMQEQIKVINHRLEDLEHGHH